MNAPRIPAEMKAVVTTGHGRLDKLDYRTVPVPAPAADEVLVKVAACGLNNTDIWTREGRYGTEEDPAAVAGPGRTPANFPQIQGADIVGTIVAVGSGVAATRIGERVIVDNTIYGEDETGTGYIGSIGGTHPGGYAEYCAVPAVSAFAVRTSLSDAELATFPCAYSTAEHMLSRAGLAAGETVLVTGASGGVGSALIQLAQARGAKAVGVARASKLDWVRKLGPVAAVDSDAPDFAEAVRRAIGRPSVEVVADVVGGRHMGALLGLLRPLGRYVTAGAIAGPMVSLDLRTIYLKHLELSGISLGRPEDFRALLGYIEAGKVKPLLHKTFPLAEIRRAQTEFMQKNFTGKLVVLP